MNQIPNMKASAGTFPVRTMLIAADGFEEVEGLTAVDLLRRAGFVCDIVSLSDTETVTGSHGIRIGADKHFSDILPDDYDAVILPGGLRGTEALQGDRRVLSLVQHMHAAGKLTAAICAAPAVLAEAGLLNGLRATCYPGAEGSLKGALPCTDSVVRDGTVITSRGVGTAIPFALAVIAYLDSQEHAEEISRKIVYS